MSKFGGGFLWTRVCAVSRSVNWKFWERQETEMRGRR